MSTVAAIHTRGAITFSDGHGTPLDLQRVFTTDDDHNEVAHFLGEAGYLHIAGVFEPDEMAAVSAEMDAVAPQYTRATTAARGGRTPATAPTASFACSTSTKRQP